MSQVWVTAVLLLMVIGSLGLLTLVSPAPVPSSGADRGTTATPAVVDHAATAAAAPKATPAAGEDPITHGDLVVGPGQTFIIQPNLAGPTYFQGGNITVEAGGTLDVWNVTLSFAQFVGDVGTAQQRLSHIYQFWDAGTVNFYDANLTTDVQLINAWAKLNLTIDNGTVNAWNTTFGFPGWIYVVGPNADLTLNRSTVTGNGAVFSLAEMSQIFGDTLWAPTITAVDHGNVTLLASQVENTYADNPLLFGYARPTPLISPIFPVGPGSNSYFLAGPSDSANLTLDYLYPMATAQSGSVTVPWAGGSGGNTTVDIYVTYNGTSYLQYVDLDLAVNSTGSIVIPFSTPLLNAISAGGILEYINETGGFGTPPGILITADNISGPASGKVTATIQEVTFQLNITGPSFDDSVIGGELSAVNTALDANWNLFNPTAGALYTQAEPHVWEANKWLFQDGAVAYLANVTTYEGIPFVFSASAFLPDASSQVYFYRWAEFNLTGRGGVLPIEGATISAYYAYNTDQSNNATAASLNDLQTTAPAIWGYLQYWDTLYGVPTYGKSNVAGEGFLLLASGNLTGPTLPDGLFLGGYHVGISVPAVGVAAHWFNWSVSPYPTGVASGTPNYNGPDIAPNQKFPDYFGAVAINSIKVTASGLTGVAVDIGQTLGVHVVLNDAGTATVTQVLAQLYYNSSLAPSALIAEYETTTLDLTAPGQQTSFDLAWLVSDNITGLHGWFTHNLTLILQWNYNIPSLAGGDLNQSIGVNFAPSMIAVTVSPLPPSTIDLSASYITQGTVSYNGTQDATIELWATPTSGGTPTELASAPSLPGNFTMPWSDLQTVYPALTPGTSYTLLVQASYNGRETNLTLAGTYTVPKSPSSPTNFFFQTFLGLPIWAWIAIAGAAAAGIVLFLVFARRQAAGKLVECGECGNLIPEDATTCPKCGAEFESDLIRCSRCASTIPANSKFCPECAAQLLGKPGEAESDPEKQAYADFTEKYRAEAKRELGDNYTEGAFWDWWKRQPSYTPFSQWSLQQGQGTARAGMTAPPAGTETTPEAPTPPKGGAPPSGATGAGWTETGAAASTTAAAPQAPPTTTVPPAAPGAGLKACPSCGKEIPSEYLVCPFCNAVTQ